MTNPKTIIVDGATYVLKEPQEPKGKRWRTKDADTYWRVNDGMVFITAENFDSLDDFRYRTANYFRTQAEANQYLAVIEALATIREYREEVLGDWKPNWGDGDEAKYSCMYFGDDKMFAVSDDDLILKFCPLGYYQTEKQVEDLISKHKKELDLIREWYENNNCIL